MRGCVMGLLYGTARLLPSDGSPAGVYLTGCRRDVPSLRLFAVGNRVHFRPVFRRGMNSFTTITTITTTGVTEGLAAGVIWANPSATRGFFVTMN